MKKLIAIIAIVASVSILSSCTEEEVRPTYVEGPGSTLRPPYPF